MVTWPLIDAAHGALRAVTAGIPDHAWDAPTPCADWTVSQVVRHAVGDQLAYAAALSVGDGPAENPFAPAAGRPDNPTTAVAEATEAARRAFAAVAPDARAVPVPVPPNSLDAPTAVGACALDAAVHAWDLAVATGQPSPLTDDLAAALLPVAHAIVEPLRAFGAYAPAIEPDGGSPDSPAAQLLRYLGRQPTRA